MIEAVMLKTIFISSFEGVETKNVLRTSIFSSLIRAGADVVLFTHDEERRDYHKKEFGGQEIRYEIAPALRAKGIDRFFRALKFLMLRTETTTLRRTMKYEMDGNRLAYYGGMIASRLLARKPVIRLVRALDMALVRNHTFDRFFEKYRPDMVFLANLFNEPEVHFLRAAKKYGVSTVGLINSWDKASGRCVLRLLPDTLIVFNEQVKEELTAYHGARAGAIFIGGIPQYDPYYRAPFSSREEFFKKIGCDPKTRLIVYAPAGRAFSDSDWDMIDLLQEMNAQGEFGAGVSLLVSFAPHEPLDMREIEKRPHLKYDHRGIILGRGDRADWDMSDADARHLADTLYHMSLLVCYASSLSVDGAVFDKPVINIDFEVRKSRYLAKSPTQYYGTTHYKKALATGGIRMVRSEGELAAAAREYLTDPSRDRTGRKRLAREQCFYEDGKSGERIGNFVVRQLTASR